MGKRGAAVIIIACIIIGAAQTGLRGQYLDDEGAAERKGDSATIKDLQEKERSRKPRFATGLCGRLDVREGFGSIAAAVPLGIEVERYGVSAEPAFLYMSMKSIRTGKGAFDRITATRTNGKAYEFGIPVMFSYTFLNMIDQSYSPFVTAGPGYSWRKFVLKGSSFPSGVSRDFSLHSLTLNYGFGFVFRISELARIRITLAAASYFNTRPGAFTYDTTGGGIQFGMMALVR